MEGSVGRVLIAKGVGSLTLTLSQWQLKQTATLTVTEALRLAQELERCAKQVQANEEEEDFSDLA